MRPLRIGEVVLDAAKSGWRVNAWVKQGILLGFRHGDVVDVSMDHGRLPFFDKDTLPLKRLDVAAGLGQTARILAEQQRYAEADARYGAIAPGDLLTSSETPGHAMKAGVNMGRDTDCQAAMAGGLAGALSGMGFKRVLLVTGEDRRWGLDYVLECVAAIYEKTGIRINGLRRFI